jgi:hypothetical protein
MFGLLNSVQSNSNPVNNGTNPDSELTLTTALLTIMLPITILLMISMVCGIYCNIAKKRGGRKTDDNSINAEAKKDIKSACCGCPCPGSNT